MCDTSLFLVRTSSNSLVKYSVYEGADCLSSKMTVDRDRAGLCDASTGCNENEAESTLLFALFSWNRFKGCRSQAGWYRRPLLAVYKLYILRTPSAVATSKVETWLPWYPI